MNDTKSYSIYHIDDCMYVAALSEADAVAYVKAECGEDCADSDWIEVASPTFMVETANVDDGEEPTPTSKRLARDLVAEHLSAGGTLPYTVAYDAGM